MASNFRYQCYVPGCPVTKPATPGKFNKDIAELSRHFNKGNAHPDISWDYARACAHNIDLIEEHEDALLDESEESSVDMESSADLLPGGRPQREKKPTEKVKVATKPTIADKEYLLPPRYLPNKPEDPNWNAKPKEIAKIYDHTKTNKLTGEKTDFYKLGNQ